MVNLKFSKNKSLQIVSSNFKNPNVVFEGHWEEIQEKFQNVCPRFVGGVTF